MAFIYYHVLLALGIISQLSSSSAVPTVWAPPTLSIQIRDITANNLTAYEAHTLFNLYTRWLDTKPALKRDAASVLNKHSNLVSIECREDLDTCNYISRKAIPHVHAAELKKDLIRRWATHIVDYTVSVHFKTYYTIAGQKTGYESDVEWDWRCETILYKSANMALADFKFREEPVDGHFSKVGEIDLNVVNDATPDAPQQLTTIITAFSCGFFGDPATDCCLNGPGSANMSVDLTDTDFAAPMERSCTSAKLSAECGGGFPSVPGPSQVEKCPVELCTQ